MLWYLRYRIRYSLEIVNPVRNLQISNGARASKGSGIDGVLYNRNSDGNLYVRYLYWNGNRWNWNYNWLDNDWNDHNFSAAVAVAQLISSFLS